MNVAGINAIAEIARDRRAASRPDTLTDLGKRFRSWSHQNLGSNALCRGNHRFSLGVLT